jgi:Glycosyl hydrolase catalytic core
VRSVSPAACLRGPAQAAPGAPTISLAGDGWHVNASLSGVDRFVFVVKVAGQPDAYFGDQTSPFLVDPWIYGGVAVSVSARAEGPKSNPWASPELRFTVAPPRPLTSLASDGWHVNAYLPGTERFVFVVKVAGLPDAYFGDQPSPFAIDRSRFGGRSVSVSARAEGPKSNPWATPELRFIVPAVKSYGIDDANGGQPGSGADAKALGITLDRINFVYGGTTTEDMDAMIALDASHGLTPLVILVQYDRLVSQFDRSGWRDWVAMVVTRYGPGGTFWQGRSDAQYAPTYFEMLNEPYGFWFYPTPEPAAYASFFADVVSAGKAANPYARFLMSSLPQTFRDEAGVWRSESWDAMLKASPDGARAQQLADGVTVHPYGAYDDPKGWLSAVGTHNDFPQLPVWITEVGYRIDSSVGGVTVTEGVQAQWMTRNLNDFKNWPWAAGYLWFKWADYGTDNMWGVVRPDGSHRPSYDAYRSGIAS